VPYVPPVLDKSDVNQIDQVFIDEQPDLDLGDGDEDVQAGEFPGFTFENKSALKSAS